MNNSHDMDDHNINTGINVSHIKHLQDLAGSGSITLSQAISSQTGDSNHAGHQAHMSDSDKADDHTALLDLFPDASSSNTAVAINGGSWFSASTWASGELPTSGMDVYIPKGVSVVYDGVSDARLDTVATDGELHFAVDVNTKMVVDTFLTGPDSVLTIGVEDNPVQQGVSAEIVIHADSGNIDISEDPTLLGRGVVTHGTVRIAGQDKADFLKVDTDHHPKAGDDFLVFNDMPHGWEVGDKLVVAAAHNEMDGGRQQIETYQDEIVTIKSISQTGDGNYTVELNQTLQYDHVPPQHNADVDLAVPVANYSRNIKISSETDNYLSDGQAVDIADRGHVMFMHNDDVSVKNTEFFELGRTDKSKLISSAIKELQEKLDAGEIRENFEQEVREFLANDAADSATNVAGRYALHFHRTGLNDLDNPAIAEGNAVYGSPGWGLVHHDANLDVVSNAVFGVVGSGIVAEAGSEAGVWSDNIVIQTTGEVVTFNAESSGYPFHPDYISDTLNDVFRQGEAYGMKSRLVEVTDNIATSANGVGFSFWPHGTENGSTHLQSGVDAYEAIQGYNPYYGQTDVNAAIIPTREFYGNEVIGSRHALNTSSNKIFHRHDMDVVIDDLLAWNVDQAIMSFYQRNYVIKDSVFIKGEGNIDLFKGFGGTGTANGEATHIHDSVDFKLVNNYFEGWDVVTVEPMQAILGNTVVGSTLNNETGVNGIFREGFTADNDSIDVIDNSSDWTTSLANPVGYLDATINVSKSDLVMTTGNDKFSIYVEKTDALGSRTLELGSPSNKEFRGASQSNWWKENSVNKGYYERDGEIYLIVDAVVGDRVTGSIGATKVAIKLAFLNGDASGLPDGAFNNGMLPDSLDANGIGQFEIVDLRVIGQTGNQLNNDYDDVAMDDPVDPPFEPPVEPPVNEDPAEDPVDETPVAPPADEDPVDETPVAPPADEPIETHQVIAHDTSHELGAGVISFNFRADSVSGTQALFSKDSNGYDNGGHLTLSIVNGALYLRAQTTEKSLDIKGGTLGANQDHSVEMSWTEDGMLELVLNGSVIGSVDGWIGLDTNQEPIVLGASQTKSGDGVADKLSDFFDGEITNFNVHAVTPIEDPVDEPVDPVDEDPVDETPADHVDPPVEPPVETPVDEDTLVFDGNNAKIIDHTADFELQSGVINLNIVADSVAGQQGLFSKDSSGYDNGGHITLMIDNGNLYLRAQTTSNSLEIRGGTVSINTLTAVQVAWDDAGTLTLLQDGETIGSVDGWTDFQNNAEPIVLGAAQVRSGDGVADRLQDYFTGQISDFAIQETNIQPVNEDPVDETPVDPPVEPPVDPNATLLTNGDDIVTFYRHDQHIVDAMEGNDSITGGRLDDILYGNIGDDIINGYKGNDVLYGGAGNDTIKGHNHEDVIIGGDGNNTLIGGRHHDLFVFVSKTSFDIIEDFGFEGDALDVSAIIEGYDPLSGSITDFVQLTQSGSGTIVSVDFDGQQNGQNYTDMALLVDTNNLDLSSMLSDGVIIV